MTDTNRKIDEVDEYQKELRNDFEYLKYDFRSFTYEISKWQIDVDERLSETEDQIQGILWLKILMTGFRHGNQLQND